MRPESVTLQLYADGAAYGEPVTLTSANAGSNASIWTYSFTGLPKTAGNNSTTPIVWTVKEVGTPENYQKTEEGLTVTNTHETLTTERTVQKKWEDNNDQDGIRPASVTIHLIGKIGDETVYTSEDIVLSKANNWTETIDKLQVYNTQKMVQYTWEEVVPDGYTVSYGEETDTTTVITNKHTPEKVQFTVNKIWNDNDNADGNRPESLDVKLSADGTVINTYTLEGTKWEITTEEFDKYKNGTEINYTWSEVTDGLAELGYTPNGDPVVNGSTITFTNNYTALTHEITVTKIWVDDDNHDGLRPDEVTFTVAEAAVAEYTTTYDQTTLTVTNTHEVELVDVKVTKVWEDNKNQDGFRPTEVKFTVTGSDRATYEVTVTGAGETWTAKVENVRKYYNGEEVTFTVAEDAVAEYTTTYDQTTLTVTNTHEIEKIELSVTKVWDDKNNQDGKRPTSLVVTLYANDEATNHTVTLSDDNNWFGKISNLDKYSEGEEIKYTWEEANIDDYTLTGTSVQGTVTTLINSYETETTKVTVKKVWEDKNNQDGIRPTEITVHLMNGNDLVKDVTLNLANGWTASVEDLDKYANGQAIDYTWTEDDIEGYTLTSSTKEGNITTLTNTHEVELVDVKVTKVWEDDNNKDKNRPAELVVTLLADGEATEQTVTLSDDNNWTDTIRGLDKYKNGTEIKYTWEETLTDAAKTLGYSQKSNVTTGYETVITNEYKTVTVEDLTVTKVWEDNKNQDGFRPASVKFTVTGSDGATYEVTVTGAGETWTAKVENVRKYYNGEEVTFTVAEDAVAEYTTTYDQTTLTVTNTHTPEKTERSIVKIWDDNDNQDRLRPDSITVNLMNGETIVGTVVLSERNQWSDTLSNLPKRANGEEINYTWEEVLETDEYELTDTTTDGALTTLTNTHEVYKVEVEVTKTWVGDEDEIANRTESITVVLVADGEVTENEIVLNAENNWTGKFENLDKFNDGEEIEYTVKEIDVENYVSQITGTAEDGYTITNTYDITNVSVEKVWTGDEDHLDDRPESVTVVLVADGEPTDMTAILLENNEWKASFEGLKKYNVEEDGKLTEIVYTIEELETEGYLSAITGDQENGYTVTNTYNLIDIKVEKVWVEKTHKYRPDSVHVSLLANGVVVAEADLSKDNNWQYVFEDLAIYTEDNKKIEYTVEETAIENYKATITGSAEEGFVVSNKLDGKIDVPDTGDNNAPVYGSIVSVTSLILLAISIVMKKKYEYLH